ncbi:MAG: ABC transporter ATP-binding protein [Christensenellaceae bacterium]|nr:ABC transporter ATP-binding protein [Christensenellaceae bacterium]
MTLLTCKDLSLGYDGATVVEGLNFTVNAGDYLCIVGENGSGKSTLIKTILRLKSPISGEILTGGGLKPNQIGYLPQQTQIQKDFPASVMEVVLSGTLNQKGFKAFYNKADKQKAKDNLAKMDILNLQNKCYSELSGGQQQRVLLARALCATQKLLLLDEPVSGLDPKLTIEMYKLIEKLNKEHGITIIMISHDFSAALKYASHILHIGYKPLFFGTKDDYLNSEVGKAFSIIGGVANA